MKSINILLVACFLMVAVVFGCPDVSRAVARQKNAAPADKVVNKSGIVLPYDNTNPVIYDNDFTNDYVDWYLMALATAGDIKYIGISTSSSVAPYNEHVPANRLAADVAKRREIVRRGRNSGFRHVPDPIPGTKGNLIKPASGKIEDTRPIGSPGSRRIVEQAGKATPAKPLVVCVGGPLTVVADAYLLDNSIADKVVVAWLDNHNKGMTGFNGWSDGWAAFIVLEKIRLVQFTVQSRPFPRVTKSRLRTLPDNEAREYMLALKTDVVAPEGDADGPPAISLMRPDYVKSARRVSFGGWTTRHGHEMPMFRDDPSGRAIVVTSVDRKVATEEWWRAMTNPVIWNATSAAADKGRIQPCHKNPRYWQYKGKPVLLLGGTKDDNLFQLPDLKEHLNLLKSVGGNYIRNAMSSRPDNGFEVQPYKKSADGKYDLDQWNDEYWNRFENMLRLTAERDIIVQVEVWAFHDFGYRFWNRHPLRPANNINYSASNTSLKAAYSNIGKSKHDFFFTVPRLKNDTIVLKYQQKFVDKILSYTLSCDHVLYCMTNEIHPNYSPEWGWYWSRYIKAKAAAAGVTAYTSEMYWQTDMKKPQQRDSLDRPEIFPYFEASQNSAILGQKNWDNLQFAYNYLSKKTRPINHAKIYGADTSLWEKSTTRHASECFWRNIVGGSASSRFHRPPYGMGLSKDSQAHIKSMRLLTAELDIFNAVPDSKSRLLSNRGDNEAYLTYSPGRQYAVYFTNGGAVDLDLSEAKGSFVIRWLDIAKSRWHSGRKAKVVKGGQKVTLRVPGKGHWAALIERR
jgi:hypothetical protein